MIEIKQNTNHITYVYLVDSSDNPVTGLSSATVFYSKAGGNSTQLASPTFSELDAINFPGVYKLTLPSTISDVLGELSISVSGTGTTKWFGKYIVRQNLESDTKSVVDAIKTTVDTNVDAKISTRASQTSLDNGVSSLNTEINQVSAEVWSSSSRTLSTFSGIENTIINGVWNRLLTDISTFNSIGKLLKDNINTTISSRADQTSVNNISANVWAYSQRQLTSFGTLVEDIKNSVWSATTRTLTSIGNFAQEVWGYTGGRTLTQSVTAEVNPQDFWEYQTRTLTSDILDPGSSGGIGQHLVNLTIYQDNALSNNHYARCFDINKNPLFEVSTGVNNTGVCSFNLDNGIYYIQVFKGGTWTQEQQIIINNAGQNLTFNTQTAIIPTSYTFDIKNKSSDNKWSPGEKLYFVANVINHQKQSFVISNATYEVKDGNGTIEASGNCTIDFPTSTVYFLFTPQKTSYYKITIKVNIGLQEIVQQFTVDVS